MSLRPSPLSRSRFNISICSDITGENVPGLFCAGTAAVFGVPLPKAGIEETEGESSSTLGVTDLVCFA